MNTISHGQPNVKGINYQQWAALALFLQYCKISDFEYIHLEPEEDKDFNLKVGDQTIICEAKNRQRALSHSLLLSILQGIQKDKAINENVKILVISNKVNKSLLDDVKNYRFWSDKVKPKFRGYSEKELALLPIVDFWVINEENLKLLVYALFEDMFNYWMPEQMLHEKLKSILVDQFYDGSAVGKKYNKQEFLKYITDNRDNIIKHSTLFNNEFNDLKTQFQKLINAAHNNKRPTFGESELTSLSAQANKFLFLLEQLRGRKLILSSWAKLWKLINIYPFYFRIFEIFKNNLNNKNNREYILRYIKAHTKKIRGFYGSDFFYVDIVKIITTIIEDRGGSKYLNTAFDIISDLLTFDSEAYFYMKGSGHGHSKWEKEEICKLLNNIYSRASAELKNKIVSLLLSTYNITEDDSEFSDHAPRPVYEILQSWINEDFQNRFSRLVGLISSQYDRYYKQFSKKIAFTGWEHMGGGISFSGGHHVSDRHFVHYILSPAIKKYFDSDQIKGWEFVKLNCVSKTAKVSKQRPDFLNRSVLNIVIEQYVSGNDKNSSEAFRILREFILARRGIPHKSDLIFQAIRGYEMPDEKKWRLVKISTDKYKLPVNPFAQQIVTELAKNGHQEAKTEFAGWFRNPKFYQSFLFDMNASLSIRQIMDSDLDFAVELTQLIITSDHIKSEHDDRFGAYDIAELVQQILQKSYEKGLSLLRLLENESTLSKGQQIVYAYSTHNHHGNDESDDSDLLLKVYADVIDPFLTKFNNSVTEIQRRLPEDGCRAALVQFAVRLAQKKKIAEAIRIIRIFVDDPDPYLPGMDPNDPKNEYSEHLRIEKGDEPHTITSARGWCGWALMKCSVLDGRQQIPEMTELTKKLAQDQNYYVVHMSCFALSQLARNRLTVLPSDKDILFFSDDKTTALQMAKDVEDIAFDLLRKLSTWPPLVQKAMAKSILHPFEHIRALNEQKSLEFAILVTGLNAEALKEAAPFLIYLAEFRKEAFVKWRFSAPGLYDDLGPDQYDASKFTKILIETIDRLADDDPDDCFQIASSAEHAMRELATTDIERKQYTDLALKYFDLVTKKYGHHIFTLVYGVIEKKLAVHDEFTERWFDLFMKCLQIEAEFYEESRKTGNFEKIRWYPSLYHSKILDLINKEFGTERFMQAAKIFFSFPKEFELYETDEVVTAINELAKKKDKDAVKIIDTLIERNPSKYWPLRSK